MWLFGLASSHKCGNHIGASPFFFRCNHICFGLVVLSAKKTERKITLAGQTYLELTLTWGLTYPKLAKIPYPKIPSVEESSPPANVNLT